MAKRNFNLLKPLQPPTTAWDKIYDWLIGKARVVILVTELIVATTFVFKVVVDTTAKNKDREIQRFNQELEFFAVDLEPTFRKLQLKADKYIEIWNNSTKYNDALSEVIAYIQNESSEISISIKNNEISVNGYEDLNAIKSLEQAIKASPRFGEVVVNNLTLTQKEVLENKGNYSLSAKVLDINRELL